MTFVADSESSASNTTNIPVTSSINQNSVVEGNPTRHELDRGSQINRPSWKTSDKRPRFLAIRVTVSNINFANQKTMSIAINNSLSYINILFVILVDDENKMIIHVDICATMNIGDKTNHQWFMSKCSNMVAEYIECGPNTNYGVV